MTNNLWLLIYALLFIVCVIFEAWKGRNSKKFEQLSSKSRIFGDIEAVASAYVNFYETTQLPGAEKMSGVVNATSKALESRGYKLDPIIIQTIQAFAEQEVAKLSKNAEPKQEEKETVVISEPVQAETTTQAPEEND